MLRLGPNVQSCAAPKLQAGSARLQFLQVDPVENVRASRGGFPPLICIPSGVRLCQSSRRSRWVPVQAKRVQALRSGASNSYPKLGFQRTEVNRKMEIRTSSQGSGVVEGQFLHRKRCFQTELGDGVSDRNTLIFSCFFPGTLRELGWVVLLPVT